ncbi:hypothetical protein Goari_010638 [Gossypium aridum]|uniref:Uncharacterized protein n=1 Tax=Gossypium aridum TaxID=34290 RepID=A0A7J8Y101_GOSAI|nr:hypothetical protein [Gossypium aridum]
METPPLPQTNQLVTGPFIMRGIILMPTPICGLREIIWWIIKMRTSMLLLKMFWHLSPLLHRLFLHMLLNPLSRLIVPYSMLSFP